MEKLTPEKSLDIINNMIQDAKRNYQAVNIYFLLWGTLLSLSGIADYILEHHIHMKQHWVVWIIQGVIGGIASGIIGKRQTEHATPTLIDRIITAIWSSFSILLALIIFTAVKFESNPAPYIMMVTGLPTLVTGYMIRFKPLVYGGVAFWIWGIIAVLWLPQYTAILFSLSIITGYLIPGFMLKQKEKSA